MNGGLIHRLCPLMGLQYVNNTIKIEVLENEFESVSLFCFSMLTTCCPIETVYTRKISSPFYSCLFIYCVNWREYLSQNYVVANSRRGEPIANVEGQKIPKPQWAKITLNTVVYDPL